MAIPSSPEFRNVLLMSVGPTKDVEAWNAAQSAGLSLLHFTHLCMQRRPVQACKNELMKRWTAVSAQVALLPAMRICLFLSTSAYGAPSAVEDCSGA